MPRMSTDIASGGDVVAYLTAQHQQVAALIEQVAGSGGPERREAFTRLRRLLAVHETAEEEIVHRTARKALGNGDAVAAMRLREERDAKQALAELERLDVDSPEFTAAFAEFRGNVLAHAAAEEHDEFPQLAAALDEDQLRRMRRSVELAEKVAPTHPHAGVEYASEHALAGPFAAMVDRARDLLTGER